MDPDGLAHAVATGMTVLPGVIAAKHLHDIPSGLRTPTFFILSAMVFFSPFAYLAIPGSVTLPPPFRMYLGFVSIWYSMRLWQLLWNRDEFRDKSTWFKFVHFLNLTGLDSRLSRYVEIDYHGSAAITPHLAQSHACASLPGY